MHIPFKFNFPRDGVVLFNSAGEASNGKLKIKCNITADPGSKIVVNGVLCTSNLTTYTAEITLDKFRNVIYAKDLDSNEEQVLTVFYAKDAHMKYQFSLDDNIWCFQNIAKNQHIYNSVFEEPYLALLKTMHDRYGTKFHMNIYYECPEFGGFDITQMPDKYKSEWEYNSDWLRMSFHARANEPDRTYIRGTYDEVLLYAEKVHNEIIRFAGEKTLNLKTTTIHWGDTTVEGCRALRNLGVRLFAGSFNPLAKARNNAPVAYYLGAEECFLLDTYGAYYDKKEDMFFRRGGTGTQHTPLDQMADNYAYYTKTHPLYTYRAMCVHEEYFYPFYKAYMPNYYERFDTAIKWHVENGFKSEFAADVFGI